MEYRQKQKNPLWGKKPKRIFLKLVKLYYKHDETTFKQYVKITRNNKEK